MISPQFGKNNIIRKVGIKSKLIVYYIRDSLVNMLIEFSNLNVNNIHQIDIVAWGKHNQGANRFSMILVYVMDNGMILKRMKNVDYINYWKLNIKERNYVFWS